MPTTPLRLFTEYRENAVQHFLWPGCSPTIWNSAMADELSQEQLLLATYGFAKANSEKIEEIEKTTAATHSLVKDLSESTQLVRQRRLAQFPRVLVKIGTDGMMASQIRDMDSPAGIALR